MPKLGEMTQDPEWRARAWFGQVCPDSCPHHEVWLWINDHLAESWFLYQKALGATELTPSTWLTGWSSVLTNEQLLAGMPDSHPYPNFSWPGLSCEWSSKHSGSKHYWSNLSKQTLLTLTFNTHSIKELWKRIAQVDDSNTRPLNSIYASSGDLN